jgi:hypothetical protein
MQFMRLADIPIGQDDRVFRYSPVRALFVAFSIICASGGLALFGWNQQNGLAYYAAGVLLLGLIVMHKFIRARFQPSNWLMRLNDQGMFLQFRSYLNHHFPAHDLTVVFIPYHEIRSVRLVHERSNIPYRDLDRPLAERSSVQRRRLVELELTGDLAPLAQALTGESTKRPFHITLYQHYPVRMPSPPSVQIEWGVVPSPTVLVDALRRYTNIASPIEVSHDYANLEGLSRKEQEGRLLALVEAGKTLDAIYVARRLYAYDLTQARAFVESLRGSRSL